MKNLGLLLTIMLVLSATGCCTGVNCGSSAIKAAQHDPQTSTLTIDFPNGSQYSYADVPQQVYIDFMNAESKGKFFNQNIKGKYKAEKVD